MAQQTNIDAEWQARALAKLPGLTLEYWCSPAAPAVIVSAVPYRGAYGTGPRGFAASIVINCHKGAGQVRSVPTVLEANEVAYMTGEPIPEGSRWA